MSDNSTQGTFPAEQDKLKCILPPGIEFDPNLDALGVVYDLVLKSIGELAAINPSKVMLTEYTDENLVEAMEHASRSYELSKQIIYEIKTEIDGRN